MIMATPDQPGGSQRGLVFGSFKNKRSEEIMDAIFEGIQKMPDSDNKQLMLILFKYNRALQGKIATHRAAHVPSAGAYVPPSNQMITTWQRKEQGNEDAHCRPMGLAWRQAMTQFSARQTVLKRDKDFKDLDEEGTEDPRQADRVEPYGC